MCGQERGPDTPEYTGKKEKGAIHMKITEIAGKCIKESGASITCIDEYGKTAGVVRGIRWYQDLPMRDEVEWRSRWKKAGFTPEYGDLKRFALVDGEWHVIIPSGSSHLEEIKARYEGKIAVVACKIMRAHDGQW